MILLVNGRAYTNRHLCSPSFVNDI